MSDATTRVCDHCGAPLRGLLDGRCPYCRTVPVARGGPAAAGGPGVAAGHTVVLLDAGRNAIAAIKALREIVQEDFGVDLGLAEAKDLIDRANGTSPPALVVDVDADRARRWAATFTRVGATVEIRPALGTGAPAAAAPAPTPPAGFAVLLTGVGRNAIGVIKAVRELTGLGLAEAKDLVDAAGRGPVVVVHRPGEADARSAADQLARAGATAEVRAG